MENQEEYIQKLQREHRALLQRTAQKSWESYDRTVLTLSGGALGISFAFIKDAIGDSPINESWILILGWSCLALSMGVVLFSFFAAGKANERAVVQFDAQKEEATGGFWNSVTSFCNPLSGILLISGVLFVISFVSQNLTSLQGRRRKGDPH